MDPWCSRRRRKGASTTGGGVPKTVLYQVVLEHLETFLAQAEAETGSGFPILSKRRSMPFLSAAS